MDDILYFVFFMIPSIVFIGFGVWSTIDYMKIEREGVETKAVVKKIVEHLDKDLVGAENSFSTTYYLYDVTYSDRNGVIYNERTENGTDEIKYKVGEEVSLIYMKSNPKRFFLKGDSNWISYVFIIFGILFFIIAMFRFIK